jgi:hypothetical protein
MGKRDLTTEEAVALVAPLSQVLRVFVNLHRMRDQAVDGVPRPPQQMREFQERITVMTWNIRDEMRELREVIDGEKESKKSDDARAKVGPTEQEESGDP